jgi:superfamily II DNA or RNA helicase
MTAGRKRISVQSPTGSGKTIMFSYIIKEMERKGKRALIITDRIELLFETGGTLEQFQLKPFYIMAGQMSEPPAHHQVYIAMSQTLRLRIGKWHKFFNSFDVVVCDENHKQEFNPYFEHNCFPDSYILGFSATPQRVGKQRQLSTDYEVLVQGLQVPELIKLKKLVPDKLFGTEHADMKGVKLNSFGDYQESGMFDRFNKRELYEGAVQNWKALTPNTITLCFCVNIQHVINTCKTFNEAGVPSMFLVSDVALPVQGEGEAGRVRYEQKKKEYDNFREVYPMYSGDREQVIADWKAGKYKVLCNAGILTTGFNYPEIETIIINRATTSIPLWLQMLGRGSRIAPSKTHFNILDFGGNCEKLGYYNQQRDWSLSHDQSTGGGAPPVKECGKMGDKRKTDKHSNAGCGCYVFASAKICPFCGYVFELEKELKFAELVEINYSQPLTIERNIFDELEREAESRGYKHGWVINQIIAKQGEKGLFDYAKSRKYQQGWIWMTKKRYANQIKSYNSKNN